MPSGRNSTKRVDAAQPSGKRKIGSGGRYDVIVVGGGPSGSTLAWKLARSGVNTLVLDGARFPREKVCGDYVEPGGLRLLKRMGCLAKLETLSPLPITHSSTYVDFEKCYTGKIPFYGIHKNLLPHAYIIPRRVLDDVMLDVATRSGATVHQETYVTGFEQNRNGVVVRALRHGKRVRYRGRMIVGADGVNSVVARAAGILADDDRHLALSQRAYADGYDNRRNSGEITLFFDRDWFPGYGWVFPMGEGRVNLGVGILKEACQRDDIALPQLFRDFFAKLKRHHPPSRKLELCGLPVGGIVKTYGGAGPNYFEKGLLVGDAGSFVDPMTGEGITPGMESSLIAARVILRVLETGNVNSQCFSTYEREYHKYFDPAMSFLAWCAAVQRNRDNWPYWRKVLMHGCDVSGKDEEFAQTLGACFGGPIKTPGILTHVWIRTVESLLNTGVGGPWGFPGGRPEGMAFSWQEMIGCMGDSWLSFLKDPVWYTSWTMDVQRKWMRVCAIIGKQMEDQRAKGLI
ncbi:MAG TPA: NAD(P)/FAD-dependent oxidoreductase [Candidatus Sulfotelmatobacter sp.]|nr:NAD(P)/FAD-dependent oxidoreductase [Candidatus Sulfotelmatobacter sp.]